MYNLKGLAVTRPVPRDQWVVDISVVAAKQARGKTLDARLTSASGNNYLSTKYYELKKESIWQLAIISTPRADIRKFSCS